MPRTVVEYRCLLISPGDVDSERVAVSDVVALWNAQVGEALGARVTVVRWETHSVPDASGAPQDVLNRQIVDNCDFAVAVFWSRVGTPTSGYQSGSIEEIQRLRERGARVLIYFNTSPIPQSALTDEQFQRLRQFKKELQQQGLYAEYGSIPELREQVQLHLTSVVAGLLQRERGQPSPGEGREAVLTAPKPDVRVLVYTALVLPDDEPRQVLHVVVQNHSPVSVFISNISIVVRDGRRLWLHRDTVTHEMQTRRGLRSGESYSISADGYALAKDFRIDDLLHVVVTDDVGREYVSTNGALQSAVRDFVRSEPSPDQKTGEQH